MPKKPKGLAGLYIHELGVLASGLLNVLDLPEPKEGAGHVSLDYFGGHFNDRNSFTREDKPPLKGNIDTPSGWYEVLHGAMRFDLTPKVGSLLDHETLYEREPRLAAGVKWLDETLAKVAERGAVFHTMSGSELKELIPYLRSQLTDLKKRIDRIKHVPILIPANDHGGELRFDIPNVYPQADKTPLDRIIDDEGQKFQKPLTVLLLAPRGAKSSITSDRKLPSHLSTFLLSMIGAAQDITDAMGMVGRYIETGMENEGASKKHRAGVLKEYFHLNPVIAEKLEKMLKKPELTRKFEILAAVMPENSSVTTLFKIVGIAQPKAKTVPQDALEAAVLLNDLADKGTHPNSKRLTELVPLVAKGETAAIEEADTLLSAVTAVKFRNLSGLRQAMGKLREAGREESVG